MDKPEKVEPGMVAKDIQDVKADEPKVPQADDVTVGDVLDTKPKAKGDDSVPLATFLELKNSSKNLEKQMKDLKKLVEDGASKKEISADIKSIAEKHDVDATFLEDFAATIRKQAKEEVETEVNEKFKPLEEKDRAEKINKAFEDAFKKTMEKMPEYSEVVNKDVIKALSLLPANSNKTFEKLIEESYGHLVVGKKTMESTTPRGGKDDNQEVDFNRAKKDPAYFSEIMKDPLLKKKYNENIENRLAL